MQQPPPSAPPAAYPTQPQQQSQPPMQQRQPSPGGPRNSRFNRPYEQRWCPHCEVDTHNGSDCRSGHLPQGFVRLRRDCRRNNTWDETTQAPIGQGSPYRPPTGLGARREMQQQQWQQRGPPPPQGPYSAYPDNLRQPPPPGLQPLPPPSPNGHLREQVTKLETMDLERRLNDLQNRFASSASSAAAASSAPNNAGVHPERQLIVKFQTNVLRGSFPTPEQRAAYSASFQASTLDQMGQHPTLLPHEQMNEPRPLLFCCELTLETSVQVC